ncbi:MAG: citrate synthase, partial [Candidatus Poribacteria bacterium]
AGKLVIGGYAIEDLAPRASFEEVTHLLWHDRLPNSSELASLKDALAESRDLPVEVMGLLRAAAAKRCAAIDALRFATDALALGSKNDDPQRDAVRLVAAMPTIVATYSRLLQGLPAVAPRRDLGHAENTLYMLTGEPPAPMQVRALEAYWITVAEHGLNASTFAARVIVSTHSDLVSAVTGALGALKGPRHGGVPGPVLDMLREIGEPDRAEPYLRAMLERGDRIMGFGHRAYKVRDPRAAVLERVARPLFEKNADDPLLAMARAVEQTAVALLDEYKPGRGLRANVEFYAALVLHALELPKELFTPMFALSRAAGWTAHALEQLDGGRLIRPFSEYVGRTNRQWEAPDERP